MDPQTPQSNQPAPIATPAPEPTATTSQGAPSQPAPEVPATWPGAFGLYKYSKAVTKFNLGTALILYVISILAGGILYVALGGLGRLIGDIVSVVFGMALVLTYLAGVRGEKLSVGQALSKCRPMLVVKYIICTVFLALAIGFSLILLIIPFFIVFPRVVLAPYFLLDRNLGPFAAINASWEATKGRSGMIWGIMGATLAMSLLMVTIIGIPFALYFLFMYGGASVLAYAFITRANDESPVTPAVDTPVTPVQPAV